MCSRITFCRLYVCVCVRARVCVCGLTLSPACIVSLTKDFLSVSLF